MSKLLRNNWNYLRLIVTATKPQKTVLLKSISKDQLRAVGELAANIYYGVLPISRHFKERLSKYKSSIAALSEKNNTVKNKQHLVQKNSNLIVLLIKAAQASLESLFDKI